MVGKASPDGQAVFRQSYCKTVCAFQKTIAGLCLEGGGHSDSMHWRVMTGKLWWESCGGEALVGWEALGGRAVVERLCWGGNGLVGRL